MLRSEFKAEGKASVGGRSTLEVESEAVVARGSEAGHVVGVFELDSVSGSEGFNEVDRLRVQEHSVQLNLQCHAGEGNIIVSSSQLNKQRSYDGDIVIGVPGGSRAEGKLFDGPLSLSTDREGPGDILEGFGSVGEGSLVEPEGGEGDKEEGDEEDGLCHINLSIILLI